MELCAAKQFIYGSLLGVMELPGKKFIRTTAIVGVGNTSGRLLAFLFMIVVARVLSERDYGEVRYILSIATVASTVVAAGLPSTMSRFLARYYKENYKKNIYFTNTLVLFLIFLSATLVASLLLFPDTPMIILVIIGYSVPLLYMGIVRGLMQYTKFALMSLLRNLIKIIILGFLVLFTSMTGTYVLLTYAFGGWIAILILERYRASELYVFKNGISRDTMKELLTFSIPVFITTFAFVLITQSPLIVLTQEIGYEYGAVFSTAFTFTLLYSFVPFAVLTIAMPKIASMRDKQRRIKVFSQSAAIIVFTGALLILLTIIVGKWALHILFEGKYDSSYIPMVILSVGSIFMGLRNTYSALWEGGGRPTLSTYDTVFGGLMTLGSAHILVPLYGVNGAAYSFVIGTLSSVLLSTVFLSMYLRGRFEMD